MGLLRAGHHFEGRKGFLGPWILELPVQGTLDSKNRTVCLHRQQLSCPSTPGQDHQNPKTPLHGATAPFIVDCRNWALGLAVEADAVCCIAMPSCCTRFTCPLVESPLLENQ